jgi:hypothetical protein
MMDYNTHHTRIRAMHHQCTDSNRQHLPQQSPELAPFEQIHINAVLIADVMDNPMSRYAARVPEGLLAAL